jgi:hypothetical protein
MTLYDPRGHTWDSWCSLTAELFAPQQLGVVIEDRWREWANGMAGNGYFMSSNIPDTRTFDNWQDWAASLVGIMSIQP